MTEDATTQPAPAEAAAAPPKRSWVWRFGMVALGGALISVVGGALVATAMRYDLVDKLAGFGWLFRSLPVGAAALVIALVTLIAGFVRKSGPKRPAILAVALVAAYFGYIASQVVPGLDAPMMHDVTTDIDDPPQFSAIELPADNLRGFESEADWQAAHREGYPDMQPVVVNRSPAEVLARARVIAENNGWEIVDEDQSAGRLEAVAFASYVRFNDFVIVEVTPIADGSTRVDMRSTSQVGLGDIGYNAARIRAFLADLQAS